MNPAQEPRVFERREFTEYRLVSPSGFLMPFFGEIEPQVWCEVEVRWGVPRAQLKAIGYNALQFRVQLISHLE